MELSFGFNSLLDLIMHSISQPKCHEIEYTRSLLPLDVDNYDEP